jgi:hypothetical protein
VCVRSGLTLLREQIRAIVASTVLAPVSAKLPVTGSATGFRRAIGTSRGSGRNGRGRRTWSGFGSRSPPGERRVPPSARGCATAPRRQPTTVGWHPRVRPRSSWSVASRPELLGPFELIVAARSVAPESLVERITVAVALLDLLREIGRDPATLRATGTGGFAAVEERLHVGRRGPICPFLPVRGSARPARSPRSCWASPRMSGARCRRGRRSGSTGGCLPRHATVSGWRA